MSALGLFSYVANGLGLLLLIIGLYRRDPAAQQVTTRVRAGILFRVRRLIHRPPQAQTVAPPPIKVSVGLGGVEVKARPAQRDENATTAERLTWLEQTTDNAYRRLHAEAIQRRADVQRLNSDLDTLRQTLGSDVLHL